MTRSLHRIGPPPPHRRFWKNVPANRIAVLMAAEDEKQSRLDETPDALRQRYGRRVMDYGNVHDRRDTAPMRVSFTHILDVGGGRGEGKPP